MRTWSWFGSNSDAPCCALRTFSSVPSERLHVVAHLVSENVRLREIAWRLEAGGELVVEVEIDVHLAIGRAIERAGGGVRHAAPGADLFGEEHELRRCVRRAIGLEDGAPGVLGLAEHRGHELAAFIGRRSGLHLRLRRVGYRFGQTEDGRGIHAEEIGCRERDERAADAQTGPAAEAPAAIVLDVAASSTALPPHGIDSSSAGARGE